MYLKKISKLKNPHILSLFLFFCLSLLSLKCLLLSEGDYIQYGDLNWGPDELEFRNYSISYSFNLNNILRYMIWKPIIILANILSIQSNTLLKIMLFSIKILMGVNMYFLLYKIYTLFTPHKHAVFFTSLIGGFVYSYNPVSIGYLGTKLNMSLGYSLLPLIVYLYINSIYKNNTKSLILCSLIISASISNEIHYIIYSWFIVISISITFIFHGNIDEIKQMIVKTIVMFIIFILASFYWIIPSVYKMLYKSGISPDYALTLDMLNVFSKPTLLDVIRLMGNWLPSVPLNYDNNIWILSSFILPSLVFISLLLPIKSYQNRIIIIILSIYSLLIIYLNSGLRLGDLYLILYAVPIVGWLFRVPTKFCIILALLYTILASSVIFYALNFYYNHKNKLLKITICIFILLFIVCQTITNQVAFLGDYGVNFELKSIPASYYEIKELDNNGRRIAFYPYSPYWRYLNEIMLSQLENSIIKESLITNDINKIYHIMRVRSIDDLILIDQNYEINKIIINNQSTLLKIVADPLMVDLHNVYSLDMYGVENSQSIINIGDVLMDTSFNDLFKRSDKIILENYNNDMKLAFLNGFIIIKPFDHTLRHKPNEIWSKASTSDPLHGTWHNYLEQINIQNWQYDYGKGLVFTWAKHVILEIPYTIPKTDQYILMARVFQNQQGGRILIQNDQEYYTINTPDQLNKFTWIQLDNTTLQQGQHKLTLTNIDGFNAVNLYALIPAQEYREAQTRLTEALQDKRIIHILEAETDLYRENTAASNKYGAEASNGQTLELNSNSTTWREIEIVKPGNYTIVIRSRGNLNIKIDEKDYRTYTNQLDWVYINPIHLETGTHKIEITSPPTQNNIQVTGHQPTDLDVVWIYSTDKPNETLEDIFRVDQAPAQLLQYTKIDPTKYTAKINATKPFMLSFAENYNPLWVARVNGEKISSIPLYSVINGFWIEETGTLDIIIEYEPQRWFYIGLAISITTLAACITYITYSYTKNNVIHQKIINIIKKTLITPPKK